MIVVFKILDIRTCSAVTLEKEDTNKVSPTIATVYSLGCGTRKRNPGRSWWIS